MAGALVVSPPGEDQVCWRGSGVLATIFSAGKVRSAALVRCAGDYLFCWQELGVLLWVRCAGEYLFCWQGSGVLLWVRSAALVRRCRRVSFLLAGSGVLLWVRCAGKYFFSAGKGQKCSGSGVAAGRAWCCGSVRLAGKVNYLIKKRAQEQNCMECSFTFSLEQVGLPCFPLCSWSRNREDL